MGGGPSTSTVTVVTPSSSSAPPFAAGALPSALALRKLYIVASIPIHVAEYAMACERRTDVGVAGHTFTNPVHSSFHHETGLARFDPDDVAVVDASFKTCPALASVPRATHAALSSTPLRVAGVHPDARVAANHRHARAHPEALRRATYPTVRAYANVYAETFEEIRASRRAMTASGGAVFVADGEHRVAVFYAPAEPGTAAAAVPFPPPRDSPVRAAVDAAREERTVTPRVAFVRGGAENPRAFDEMLAEERDVEGVDGGGGLAGFVAEVERRARAFMRESDA